MSGAVRVGVVFGLAAVAALVGSSLLGIAVRLAGCLGFISTIALGLGAGYTAAKVTAAAREQRVGRGATAGAIAGLTVLILGGIGSYLVTLLPAYQAQLQNVLNSSLQQSPNAGINPNDVAALAGVTGIVGSFCSGLINGIVMAICGLLGALFWKGAPATGEYVAVGPSGGGYGGTGTAATYDTGSTTGTGYGTTTGTASTYDTSTTTGTGYGQTGTTGTGYGTTGTGDNPPEGEGGVRVYDTDDRNRM